MPRIRPARALAARQGVILLVVISLLTLFAVVGITFVIYAQTEVNLMRVARQSENLTNPDADPEMLLNYFLSQLIYGPPDGTFSAMRNWDLARNIYGRAGNTVPFNGAGRLLPMNNLNMNYTTSPILGQPPNNTQADADGAPNPPYTYPDANCLSLAAVQGSTGAVLVPSFYRYIGTAGVMTPLNGMRAPITDPTTMMPVPPEDGVCDVKNLPLSPGLLNQNNPYNLALCTPNDSIWMDLGFPVLRSANGQKFKPLFAALIQDLDGRPNVNMVGNILASLPNGGPPYQSSSHQGWSPGEVNLGPTILVGAGGPPYEAGNLLLPATGNGRYDPSPNQWGSVAGTTEVLSYAYAPAGHFYSATNIDCFPQQSAVVSKTNPVPGFTLPQNGTAFAFPQFGQPYGNGWWNIITGPRPNEGFFNPMLFNFFSPHQSGYTLNFQSPANKIFPASDMEALLRYGDTGSPALTSDLLALCPLSFKTINGLGTQKALRLVTTHSFDLSAPGMIPNINMLAANIPQQSQYQLAQPQPQGNPPVSVPGIPTLSQGSPQLTFPPPLPAPNLYTPNAGEFGNTNWGSASQSPGLTQLLKRIDLNRGFTNYPTLVPAGAPGADQFTSTATYQTALQDRQMMAQEIFNVLIAVTGANATILNNGVVIIPPPPAQANNIKVNATVGTPPYDALRWLAQLAVNIVDFVNFSQAQASQAALPPDDVMTSFNWNPAQASNINNGWVFGTVLPRLVLNEAFVQIANVPTDLATMGNPPRASMYNYNFWVELHNTFAADNLAANPNNPATPNSQVNANQCVPTALQGRARLYFPPGMTNPNGYAGYRIICTQSGVNSSVPNPIQNSTVMTANDNVLGVPQNITSKSAAVVDQYSQAANDSSPAPGKPITPTPNPPVDTNQVLPGYNWGNNANATFTGGQMQPGTTGGNTGYYVAGPNTAFPPGKSPKWYATLAVDNTKPLSNIFTVNDSTLTQPTAVEGVPMGTNNNNSLKGMMNDLHYLVQPAPRMFPQNLPTHTIVLQRLACPYMPPQPNPAQALFNPYVTVDYINSVPTYDAVTIDTNGTHTGTTPNSNYSTGRNQPYAADASQLVNQGATGKKKPGNTFFKVNAQSAASATQQWAYDWLFHANRPLVSPIELLQVSGYKPHQLTQMFMTGGVTPQNISSTNGSGRFNHRAPWITQGQIPTAGNPMPPPLTSPMIYRALEFFEAGLRPQWSPIGGRFPGKININTIWDSCTWGALCDPQTNNFFTNQAVPGLLYSNLTNGTNLSRTPGVVPSLNDMPFLSLAAPFSPSGGQYPQPQAQGCGIQNTLLRPDPAAGTNNPLKLLLEPKMNTALGAAGELIYTPAGAENNSIKTSSGMVIGHPYLRMELLNKIFNSLTTRSNVFAVWLTVGFFEVPGYPQTGDASPTQFPPILWPEINKGEGRNIRHRMFAIIDRTNLTIAAPPIVQTQQPFQLQPQAGSQYWNPGPRPFFINSLKGITSAQANGKPRTVTLPPLGGITLGGNYEDASWNIQVNMPLVIDSGPNQEVVLVTRVTPAANQFRAAFTKPHPVGFSVSGACNWSAGTPVPILGNPGPQPFFDMRNPVFSGVVRYFSIIQ